MPKIFLSPSTQEWNAYATEGNEELFMNRLADRMEPYLRASGITYVRNRPERNVTGAISDSNLSYYDVHLALHSNAAPESLSGKLRGIDIYYAPGSRESERLATIIANNFKTIYPIPDKCTAKPTTTLGEVLQTKAVAVLCEIGYHDNIEDERWLTRNLTPIAENITGSLCDYFGIPLVMPESVINGTVSANGSSLRLRSFPSVSSAVLASIPDGSRITILGTAGDWYVVSWDGYTGYAFSEFIIV